MLTLSATFGLGLHRYNILKMTLKVTFIVKVEACNECFKRASWG